MEDRFPAFAGLKAFFAVGRANGVSEAAERLGVSRSAISHQLRNLETELGIRLYDRQAGMLSLTRQGEDYLKAVEGPMSAIRDATRRIRSSSQKHRVTLTLTPSFATGWFLPRMRKLSEQFPELDIDLISTTRVVNLGTENVDLAIRRGAGQWDGLESQALFREKVVPVVSPSFLKESNATSLTDLIERSCLLVNSNLPREWEEWHEFHHLAPGAETKRFVLESYELTIEACKEGLGVALGRRPFVDALLTSQDLVQPFDCAANEPAECFAETLGYFVVWKQDSTPNAMIKKLTKWLVAEGAMN